MELINQVSLVSRLIPALILIIAAIGKFLDLNGFVITVKKYQILPLPFTKFFAYLLPLVELILGICLLIGLGTQVMALLGILLFLCFSIAVAITLLRGKELDCNCFGNIKRRKVSARTILENLFFIGLLMVVLLTYNGYLSVDALIFKWPQPEAAIQNILPTIFLIMFSGLAFIIIKQVSLLKQITR